MSYVARLGSLVFDEDTPDANGITWKWMNLGGWWASPDVRQTFGDRMASHGVTFASGFYGGRNITLAGVAITSTHAKWFQAQQILAATTQLVNTPAIFQLDEPSPSLPLQAEVYLAGPIQTGDYAGGLKAVAFQLPLIAPDPRKYDQTQKTVNTWSFGGTTQTDAVNTVAGNAFTQNFHIDVEVSGGNNEDPGIEVNGVLLRVEDFTQPGTIVRFDVYNRRVYTSPGNVDLFPQLAVTEWPRLNVGANSVTVSRITGSTGTCTATLRWRDAWL